MSRPFSRRAGARAAVLGFAAAAVAAPCAGLAAPAQGSGAFGPSLVTGVVDDAQTGLPLEGATVSVVGSGGSVVTGRDGRFVIRASGAETVRLHVQRDGYQPTDSTPLAIGPQSVSRVTLAVQQVPSASQSLQTIGVTSTSASQSLQDASTIYRTIDPEQTLQEGYLRVGDALRQLPAINNTIPGDTASLGDDLQLQIRGLGGPETLSTLDGHPIAYGVPNGFNYQLSPPFGMRNVRVTYGSAGTELTGYDAIGGIVDSETIDPTQTPSLQVNEGYGTFDRALTSVAATGTVGRLGYAFLYGAGRVDGPFHNEAFYQPGAAYDPSATSPAVRDLGVYVDDGTAVSHNGLEKLRYAFSDATQLTLTAFQSSYWENKTGNGDGDYLTPTVATAIGNNLLAGKSAKDPCPAGEFTATNANGVAWGTGPGGTPDGGEPCQTPASYASYTAGYQGAGPAWQALNFNDEALHFDSTGSRHEIRADLFTNRYLDTVDRTFQLPFVAAPGDAGFYDNTEVSVSGGTASDNFVGRNNQLGIGLEYLNSAYDLRRSGSLRGAPIVQEVAEFVRDAYHPASSPLAAYLTSYFKRSTTTNSSFIDPRLSLVYTAPGGNDVVRAAVGATTTEPTANLIDQNFTASSLVTAGGGGGLTCGGLNSIGSAPSTLLRPERGVDEEFAVGHRFERDSQIEVAFYNTNVYSKIYSSLTPLATTGAGFIPESTLASAEALVAAKCGTANPLSLLGVTGAINLGQLRSQGFTVSGRQHLDAQTFVDYDYATTSTVLVSAPVTFLQQNPTAVIGAQIPYLPLHTLSLALDHQFAPRVDLRYTLYTVSDNNNKHTGGYNYSTLRGSVGIGPGTLTGYVYNLFDQDAYIQGYLGQGVPLALNQYAGAAAYQPYLGASATEQFGLPYRAFFISYALRVP